MVPKMSVAAGLGLAAYLLGAIPFAYLLGRLKGVDIRKVGSGNVGATNVFRSVGQGWGVCAFALDALKGFVPAFFFPGLFAHVTHEGRALDELAIAFMLLAIVGHNWPVYLRFKGGKGVATSAGGLLGVAPAAVGVGFAVWVIVFAVGRYVSVASIAAAVAVGAASWWLYSEPGRSLPWAISALALLIIWRHRSNIQRLRAGNEHRFSFGSKRTGDGTAQARRVP